MRIRFSDRVGLGVLDDVLVTTYLSRMHVYVGTRRSRRAAGGRTRRFALSLHCVLDKLMFDWAVKRNTPVRFSGKWVHIAQFVSWLSMVGVPQAGHESRHGRRTGMDAIHQWIRFVHDSRSDSVDCGGLPCSSTACGLHTAPEAPAGCSPVMSRVRLHQGPVHCVP